MELFSLYTNFFAISGLISTPEFTRIKSPRVNFLLTPSLFVPAALSPQVAPSATESCFARQHNVSDNNNQCFSGANGHLPSQLAAQRPGAIDNQPLVTTDPVKARPQQLNWTHFGHGRIFLFDAAAKRY